MRITRLVKADSLLKDLIEYMLKTRNLLVHQGKFSEEGIAEVNYLKLVAELAIKKLLANSGKLTSLQHLA